MTTQATRLFEVHPWGTGARPSPRRRTGDVARGLPGLAGDLAGGLLVAGSWVALWVWFLAATW